MTMNMFSQQEGGLTEAELDRLTEFLGNSRGTRGMNIEEVDGFFAALIAGPELVLPSEYLPEIFGGEMSDTVVFAGPDEAGDILELIMRHSNGIAAALAKGDAPLPVLLTDDDGGCQGRDWSRGFMHGVGMRRAAWAELFNDEEQSGWMVPVLMLFHEHDEDPELRTEPIGPEKREKVILQMAAGTVRAYRYFRAHRRSAGSLFGAEPQRSRGKIGRNEPCPCGSGKKYKRCCGASTIH